MIKWIFATSIGWLAGKIRQEKKIVPIYEKQNVLISKQEKILETYEQWIEKFHNEKILSEYLLKNNYHEIAIYGLGHIGKQLYKELISSEINLSYVIDQNYGGRNKFYHQTPCYHPEDELPNVDLIIVTVVSEAKEIIAQLSKKTVCQLKSINDILFVI